MSHIILKIAVYILTTLIIIFISLVAWGIIAGAALAIAERKNYHHKLKHFEDAVAKLNKIVDLKCAIEEDISATKNISTELINSYTAIIAHQNTIFIETLYTHTECNRLIVKILFALYKPYNTRLKETNKLFASIIPYINSYDGELIFKKDVLDQLR